MPKISQFKVVSTLPSTLEPDAVYYVRVGTGFDIYVTNSSGTVVAYPSNQVNPVTVTPEEAQAGTEPGLRSWSPVRIWQAVAAWWAASAMKTKLDGIAPGATANSTDAQLRARATHTGTQTASTISDFGAAAIGSPLTGFTVAGSRNAITAADTTLVGFQKVQKYLNDLGTAAFANIASMPVINLMPDSGRFGGRINPFQVSVNTFTPSPLLAAYNGGSHASGGQFFDDNSTNGGAGPALTEPVSSLLTAMGRNGFTSRYGVEFFIDTYTFGSGTANPGVGTDSVTRYLATTNWNRAIFQGQQYATMVMWIRARNSSFHIQFNCYVNGILRPANTPITVAEGWVHVRISIQSGLGYNNAFPNLFGVPGSSVNIACMGFFGGLVDVGFHTSPLGTINELSA